MEEPSLVFSFFLIFSGAAVISTVALFLRQPLLVAYIVLGMLMGPFGFALVTEGALLADIAEFGILFLLFLLGLDMQPAKLAQTLRKTFLITLAGTALFFSLGYGIGWAFGFTQAEAVVIGLAMVFSSTIIGIKLLPTTVLHQKHMGELMVGILLLQDIIAILALVFVDAGGSGEERAMRALLALPLLLVFAWATTRYVLMALIARFDRFREYIFLLAIGWCLGMAELAVLMGLSAEIGAFVAGVSLAASPIAIYIAEKLKPLRDFFLILFFFSLGAQLDINLLGTAILPALVLAALALALKPVVFHFLLLRLSERNRLAWDAGLRLGQISEFSLLIAVVAANSGLIGDLASLTVQAATILSFLVSSYIVVFFCPTPVSLNPRLQRD